MEVIAERSFVNDESGVMGSFGEVKGGAAVARVTDFDFGLVLDDDGERLGTVINMDGMEIDHTHLIEQVLIEFLEQLWLEWGILGV